MDQQTLEKATRIQSNITSLQRQLRDIRHILDGINDEEKEDPGIHRIELHLSGHYNTPINLCGLENEKRKIDDTIHIKLLEEYLKALRVRFTGKLSELKSELEAL